LQCGTTAPAIGLAHGDDKKTETYKTWSLTMTRKLAAALMLGLSLVGTTVAFAQTRNDYLRYHYTGRGQCTTDEGYGRFATCDQGGN
jgi:hypothetical protein